MMRTAPEKRHGPIRGVFFDIGDTVMHIHPSVGEIYARVCRDKGMSRPAEQIQRSFRAVWEKFSHLTPAGVNRFAHFPGGEDEWWMRLVREVLAGVGIEEQPLEWYGEFIDAFRRPEVWRLYPEVGETLKRLRERGLVIGAVSNWDTFLPSLLDLVGLDGVFDPLVVSAIEDVEKPDAELFRIALRRSGLAAAETLYVGNRPEEDYRGAAAAGLKPLLIERNTGSNDGMARVENLLEILDHL